MFTANSPKRRKALRRFGDRARSRCECSQPIPRSAARPCGGSEIARDQGVNVHSQFSERQRDIQKTEERHINIRSTYDGRRERLNRLQSWYTTFTRILYDDGTCTVPYHSIFTCFRPTRKAKRRDATLVLGSESVRVVLNSSSSSTSSLTKSLWRDLSPCRHFGPIICGSLRARLAQQSPVPRTGGVTMVQCVHLEVKRLHTACSLPSAKRQRVGAVTRFIPTFCAAD